MASVDCELGVAADGTVYRPHAKQREVHRSSSRFKVIAAGNRGGKTVVGALEFLGNIFRDIEANRGKTAVRTQNAYVPRLRYWVITPTSDLYQYNYEELIRWCPARLVTKTNQTTKEISLVGDVVIQFRSTERAERLIAASLNGIWMDEASKCKQEAWRGGLRARIADQKGWALFTTTPYGGRNNWVYQDLVSKVGIDPDLASFHWTTADNDYFPREEFEKARATQPEAWFKRDWLASWDSFGGSIFEEFGTRNIVSETELRLAVGWPPHRQLKDMFSRVVGAIDWGWAAAGAIVVVGELGDTRWVVLDEVYGPGMPVTNGANSYLAHVERLSKKWGISEWVADGEDSRSVNDLQHRGVNARYARKDVTTGLRRIASAIHGNEQHKTVGFYVLDHCKHTIRQIQNYQWKQAKDGTGYLDTPADNQEDHCCDCVRYAAMELRYYDYVEQERTGRGSLGIKATPRY